MEKIKVSIIVAFYKSEPFIKKCVDSILNQTYKNLEIILVNDGSPDNCGKICKEYAKKDKRVVVIDKENGGACDARNQGLNMATGDYVSIIDGDDWLSEDYVEYLVDIVNETGCDMAMTDNIFTTRNQIQIKKDEIKKISSVSAAEMIIYPYIPIGPWNKLYNLKMINDNNLRFDVPWSGEGLYFSVMAAQYSNYVGLGHKKIYNYRLNNAGSGLTNYNITMGTNALENIKYIKDNLVIKDKRLINAADWHIWKNYYFVLKLIIATSKEKEEKELYTLCKKNLRKRMFSVFLKSKLNFKWKIKIIIYSLFPIFTLKKTIKNERKSLEKDKFE